MAYSFEVALQFSTKEIFEEAFSSNMDKLGYNRLSLAGGEQEVRGFRRDEHLISLSVTSEEHGLYRVIVHSETVPPRRPCTGCTARGRYPSSGAFLSGHD